MLRANVSSTSLVKRTATTSLRTYTPVSRSRSGLTVKAYREDEKTDPRVKYDAYRTEAPFSSKQNFTVDTQDASVKLREAVDKLQARWDEVQYKKTVITLLAGSALGAIFFSQVLGTIENLPLIPDLLTFIGLVYSASFTWRYLLFKSGRQELRGNVQDIYNSIKKAVEGDDTSYTPTSLMGGDEDLLDDAVNAAHRVAGKVKGAADRTSAGSGSSGSTRVVGGNVITPVDPMSQPGDSAGLDEPSSSGYKGYAQPGSSMSPDKDQY